jgi:hypothetical protein
LRRNGIRRQDLLEALNRYLRLFQAETGIEVAVRLHCDRSIELPISAVMLLSACCQEALDNVRSRRQAKVELIVSQLGEAVELRVRVKDRDAQCADGDEDGWEPDAPQGPGLAQEPMRLRPRKLKGGDLMVRIPLEGIEGLSR